MWRWLKKKFGYHVCEEFTQWEKKKVRYERLATAVESGVNNVRTVEWTETYQERRCTLCGRIYQENLEH